MSNLLWAGEELQVWPYISCKSQFLPLAVAVADVGNIEQVSGAFKQQPTDCHGRISKCALQTVSVKVADP